MENQDFEERTLNRTSVFKGKIIEVVLDEVELPNGEVGQRELVFHPGAVAIVPITKEGKMVLVKQFRKPLEKVILEIPAGKIEDKDTEPKETAKRELEEETGYQAQNIQPLASFYLSPGFANEIVYVFEATQLRKVEHPLPKDEDELIELYELTLDECKSAIASGLICDAKTIVAIQHWELKQCKGM